MAQHAKRTMGAKEGYLRLGIVAAIVVALVAYTGASAPREGFASSEVYFTDTSPGGLAIMPASCASSPSYYHYALTVQGAGYSIATGLSEYGAYKHGVYVCVTNTSGSTYFIPANSATELNSFKARSTVIPGLQSW